VFERHGTGLLSMTGGATFVDARHGQSTGRFENIRAMGIMALHAIHAAFQDGVMLRKIKLGVNFQMTFKASRRVLAGVYNELASSAPRRHVQAAGTMTGFTPALARWRNPFDVDAGVGTGREVPRVGGMAFGAGLVADVMRARNLRRSSDGIRDGRARVEQESRAKGGATEDCDDHWTI